MESRESKWKVEDEVMGEIEELRWRLGSRVVSMKPKDAVLRLSKFF